MKNVSFIATGSALSVFLDGTKHIVPSDHGNYAMIVAALRDKKTGIAKKAQIVRDLIDVRRAVKRFTRGHFRYDGDVLRFRSKPAAPWLQTKVKQMMEANLPIDHLLGFHAAVRKHRDKRVRDNIEKFLNHGALPVNADGTFIAWKYVREDYKDDYSGTIDNSPGKTVFMPRRAVVNNPNIECAAGLHVCAFGYLSNGRDNHRHIAVKVNVRDVVSIPNDYDHQKMRVCKYVVLEDVGRATGDHFAKRPIIDPKPVRKKPAKVAKKATAKKATGASRLRKPARGKARLKKIVKAKRR